jgi:hypothetical protein
MPDSMDSLILKEAPRWSLVIQPALAGGPSTRRTTQSDQAIHRFAVLEVNNPLPEGGEYLLVRAEAGIDKSMEWPME